MERCLATALTAYAALTLGSALAIADEWRIHAALATTQFEVTDVGDAEGHQVQYGKMTGVVFSDEGILDKALYDIVFYADTVESTICYKTFTATDGKVFARCEQTVTDSPNFKGTWKFIGGTGAYEGITGEGTYDITFLEGGTAWDILEGEYQLGK